MTSIEWLIDRLYQHEYHIDILDVATINGYFEQAKEMHKQEIIDAYTQGDYDVYNGKSYITADTAEQYYQETFVSKGKLKELYPDAYSILGEVLYKKCKFEPTINTSSATICKHCGREKYLHKI